MTSWTRVTDPEIAVTLLPAWFAPRMLGTRGSYGFLLTTGDVLRVSRVTAVHISAAGTIFIDVLLDYAGVPGGVDLAWQTKHFLGTPVPGANLATLNVAQIVVAVEFTAAEFAEIPDEAGVPATDTAPTEPLADASAHNLRTGVEPAFDETALRGGALRAQYT